jgi:4-hydroxybenzoate polyprenyltransferase/phosphoserine phosphatase
MSKTTQPTTGNAHIPLVVDLDGTLTPADVFIEDAFAYIGSNLGNIFKIMGALFRGKAQLKQLVTAQLGFDAALLPYNETVLAYIKVAKAAGRKVYLATAANEMRAEAIARHLGLFDGVFASSSTHNLSGSNKACLLVEKFGKGQFDYIGNGAPDLKIWRECREAILVSTSAVLARKARAAAPFCHVLDTGATPTPRTWLKALRVHQYSKNTLVFVPLLTSHSFTASALIESLIAFVAFCAAASSIYLTNDLIDIWADRAHPSKCKRPLARGTIAPKAAVFVSFSLLLVALGIAASLSCYYLIVIGAYIALTISYSLFIKRKLFIDIIVLSLLYTIRIWAGAVAIDVALSNWLLTFSLFVFTALALIKRYTELATRLDANLADPSNRNYRKEDLPVLGALAAACGMNAVTVFALYVSSDAVAALYPNPDFLWVNCPILVYLLGRMLIMAQRREMHDDPIVFVLHDRIWRIAIPIMAAMFLLAMYA